MGPPRTAAARLQRAPSGGRVRRWIASTGLRARLLQRTAEAAKALIGESLEFFGESADDISVGKGEAMLRAGWDRYCAGVEPGETELMENVSLLAGLLGLEEVEEEVLALFAAIPTNPELQRVLERIDVRSRHQAARVLALILGQPVERIRVALGPDSPLARYQVLNLNGGAYDFTSFGLLDPDVERALSSSRPNLNELLSAFFIASPSSGLAISDFEHLQPQLDSLIRYLDAAGQNRVEGANVLLYGWPGTGKTELSRLIVELLGWQGYEVRTANRDGSACSGDDRVASYVLAQRFLAKSERRLVIFDEIEDIFSAEYGFARARLGKLYMHRLLEQNGVPAIWVANDVGALSAPIRRRFDLSLFFGPLPRKTRRRVLERHLGGAQEDGIVAKLLDHETVLPAQVASAKRVASLVKGERNAEVMVETLAASARLLEQPLPGAEHALDFDVALCNSDVDLELVIAGLQARAGRRVVGLHGPPGTGKSALAKFLAVRLDARAVPITAASILSAFLGDTERQVARIFECVDVTSEVLLLEEAEESLGARTVARQSWEIRLVNELLTRIDAFSGVIVLTTNWLDRLDVAALRRIDLKVKLDYMRPEQRLAMWARRVGSQIELGPLRSRLQTMERLTAGDFAAVAAQAAIVGQQWHAQDWLDALQKEVSLRPAPQRQPGFA